MDNPETPTTLRTQYKWRRQEQTNKQTNNNKTNKIKKQKKNKKQKTTQKTKEMSNTGPTQNMRWNQVPQTGKQFLVLIGHSTCYSYSQDVVAHHSTQANKNNIQKRWALLQTTYRRDGPSYKQHTEEMGPTTNNIQKRWSLLQTTYRRDEPYYKQHTEEMGPTTNNIQKRWALLQTTEGKDDENIVLYGNRSEY